MLGFVFGISVLNIALGYLAALRWMRGAWPTCDWREVASQAAEIIERLAWKVRGWRWRPAGALAAIGASLGRLRISDWHVARPCARPDPGGPTVLSCSQISVPLPEQRIVEASVDEFVQGLQQFREQLARLDAEVRQCTRNAEVREVERCVQAFQAANQDYLDRTNDTASRLREQDGSLGELSAVGRSVGEAVAQQQQQVAAAQEQLDRLDIGADLSASCRELLGQAGSLSETSSQLTDRLEAARGEIGSMLGWSAETQAALPQDRVTQLASRAQFDAELQQRLVQTRDRAGALAVTWLDVDQCQEINTEHGLLICDEVLKGVARILAAAVPQGVLVARYSGQRFAALMKDTACATAVGHVELVRQVLAATRFERASQHVPVTVTCSVASSLADDDSPALVARLAASLQQAKDHGRNCTFVHDGAVATWVSPPVLAVAEQTYEL